MKKNPEEFLDLLKIQIDKIFQEAKAQAEKTIITTQIKNKWSKSNYDKTNFDDLNKIDQDKLLSNIKRNSEISTVINNETFDQIKRVLMGEAGELGDSFIWEAIKSALKHNNREHTDYLLALIHRFDLWGALEGIVDTDGNQYGNILHLLIKNQRLDILKNILSENSPYATTVSKLFLFKKPEEVIQSFSHTSKLLYEGSSFKASKAGFYLWKADNDIKLEIFYNAKIKKIITLPENLFKNKQWPKVNAHFGKINMTGKDTVNFSKEALGAFKNNQPVYLLVFNANAEPKWTINRYESQGQEPQVIPLANINADHVNNHDNYAELTQITEAKLSEEINTYEQSESRNIHLSAEIINYVMQNSTLPLPPVIPWLDEEVKKKLNISSRTISDLDKVKLDQATQLFLKEVQISQKKYDTSHAITGPISALTGMLMGSGTGAAIGTIIFPGIGTVIGAAIGAGFGGLVYGIWGHRNLRGKKPGLDFGKIAQSPAMAAGALNGTLVGAAIGATLGTLLFPGLGTIAGTVVGGFAGTVAAVSFAYVGKKVMEVVNKKIDRDFVSSELSGSKSAAKIGTSVGSALGTITGASIGGLIGSLVFPGVGTVVGAALGGIIGSVSVASGIYQGTKHLQQRKINDINFKTGLMGSVSSSISLMAVGGLIGTLVFPGLGTVAGMAIGSTAGALIGFGTAYGIASQQKKPGIGATSKTVAAASSVLGAKTGSYIGAAIGAVSGFFLAGPVGAAVGAGIGGAAGAGLGALVGGISGHFARKNQLKQLAQKQRIIEGYGDIEMKTHSKNENAQVNGPLPSVDKLAMEIDELKKTLTQQQHMLKDQQEIIARLNKIVDNLNTKFVNLEKLAQQQEIIMQDHQQYDQSIYSIQKTMEVLDKHVDTMKQTNVKEMSGCAGNRKLKENLKDQKEKIGVLEKKLMDARTHVSALSMKPTVQSLHQVDKTLEEKNIYLGQKNQASPKKLAP